MVNWKRFYTVDKIVCYLITTLILAGIILTVVVVTTVNIEPRNEELDEIIWTYECQMEKCVKIRVDANTEPNSLMKCRQYCVADNKQNLWPLVKEITDFNGIPVPVQSSGIKFTVNNARTRHQEFWTANEERFYKHLTTKNPNIAINTNLKYYNFNINIEIIDVETEKLTMEIDESYSLSILLNNDIYDVNIVANSIFGGRHGLETLIQLIYYDDVYKALYIPTYISISDGPVYKHRGLSLDTSRNYYSVESIKRTIEAMSMVKLNVFHWHITDSHSFPMVIESHPYLSQYGAYSNEMIYTKENIIDIVKFGYNRGVRIIPEFDAPAHVGEGWQSTNFTTCFAAQPWTSYCLEPPCGQLNPTIPEMYDVLGDIYAEMLDMFNDPDVFHMGGDEVHFNCWRSNQQIVEWMEENDYTINNDGFSRLWGYFQQTALSKLDSVSNDQKKIVIWTSTITENPYSNIYLDKSRYIIQVWDEINDTMVGSVLSEGFNVIMSNVDALYLDCGFGSWTGGFGNNWCSPYIGWQKVYANDFSMYSEYLTQIIGSEGALWSEQADEHSMDARYWPRAAALAERLWSNPSTGFRAAEPRILLQRERFVENGIAAESIQPRWCLQNEGECPS